MVRRKNKWKTTQRPELIFRQTWLCPVGSRRLGWLGQYLAVPIPGGKIWRWNFSADLHSAGGHLWLYNDYGRDSAGTDDPEKSGWGLCSFWKGTLACIWRMDQRGNSHFDCAVLFGYWRLGYQVSGGVYYRSWQ